MRCGTARTVAARGAPETVGPGPSRVEIDRERWQVTRDGAPVHLTRKAFLLLLALVDAGGAVVSREALYAAVWGDSPVYDVRTLDVHVAMLRRALGADVVRTVIGVGYAIGAGSGCEDWRDSARGGDRAPVSRR